MAKATGASNSRARSSFCGMALRNDVADTGWHCPGTAGKVAAAVAVIFPGFAEVFAIPAVFEAVLAVAVTEVVGSGEREGEQGGEDAVGHGGFGSCG